MPRGDKRSRDVIEANKKSIRELRKQNLSHTQIREKTGFARDTYFRYMKEIYTEDKAILHEEFKHTIPEEILALDQMMREKIVICENIINGNSTASERLAAIGMMEHLMINRVKLKISGNKIITNELSGYRENIGTTDTGTRELSESLNS